MKVKGNCLCGAVHLTAEIAEKQFDVCHCGMCRKWGGGPALCVDIGKQHVHFQGEENISVFKSSPWAERGFCKICGTHLFYRLKEGDFLNCPLGLLEASENFKFHSQIFVDFKPAAYAFANSNEMWTEAQVLAKHAPPK